jgi:opacity protein-like surface antigen
MQGLIIKGHRMTKWISGLVCALISCSFTHAATEYGGIKNHHFSNNITSTKWFISGQIGDQTGTLKSSSTTVNNGSGLSAPFNQDTYTINNPNASALLGIQVGHRWEFDNEWLTAFSLGALYQYFFTQGIDGQVIEFSTPEFTNYNYYWKSASNLILANAKLNLINYKKFSPYINGGLGSAYNDNPSYAETPFSGVTPRTSPGYTGNSGTRFAYIVGAGLDYYYTPQLIVSVGYQYSNLGAQLSGYGTQSWSSQRLNFGTYQSNAFLVSLTYLFDINSLYQK